MADCSFQFKIEADPTKSITKVKTKIEQEGGSFSGDDKAGTFSLPTPVGGIEGSYHLNNNELNIEITEKPVFLPCSMIESELKKRL